MRTTLRALTVAVLAVVAGGTVYVVLPVPSAAAPGLAHPVPLTAAQVMPPPAVARAYVGGRIDGDDLLSDPTGVTVGAAPAGPDGPLIGWPVTDHTPSTGFGYRSDPFTHRQRWHDGVDLGQPCGDAVHAALEGTVAYAGWAGGYGNRIIVRHADRNGHAFATTYNHLSRIDATVGQAVQRGQVIALIGSTGRSTACHLHFEVILDNAYVDPMRFLTGDQSKAGLSRRVGSYMPSGLPSPTPTWTLPSSTPTPTPTHRTPTPSPTGQTGTPSPTPTTPAPSTPAPTTPAPTTPTPGTPAPSTPAPTPGATTPAPALSSTAATTPGATTPAPGAAHATPTGSATPAPTLAAAASATSSPTPLP